MPFLARDLDEKIDTKYLINIKLEPLGWLAKIHLPASLKLTDDINKKHNLFLYFSFCLFCLQKEIQPLWLLALASHCVISQYKDKKVYFSK